MPEFFVKTSHQLTGLLDQIDSVAKNIGFSPFEKTIVITSVSEICRNLFAYTDTLKINLADTLHNNKSAIIIEISMTISEPEFDFKKKSTDIHLLPGVESDRLHSIFDIVNPRITRKNNYSLRLVKTSTAIH